MKKLIGAALAVIMLVSAAMSLTVGAVIYEADTYTMGDANGDGTHDARDILAIRRLMVGSGTVSLAAADVNFDGAADARDVLKMRRAAVGAANLYDGNSTVAAVTIGGVNISHFYITYASSEPAVKNIEYSAGELQEYLNKTSGVTVPVVPDDFTGEHMIVYANDETLGEDGIDIKVTGGNLYITGGVYRGCMNATYDFLERFIGWVFINEDFTYLYKNDVVDVREGTDFVYMPKISNRDSMSYSYCGNENIEKYLRLKIDSIKNRGAIERAAKYGYGEGYIGTAHTMVEYVSACTPETQICYYDADVFDEALENILAAIEYRKNKGDLTDRISVSPMDNTNYCSCSACIGNRPKIAPVNYKTDGYIGPQLNFVNRIADAVKEVYPETHVMTTAYWEARMPPKTIVPRDNVDILFCWNGCNNHSFDAEDCEYAYGYTSSNGVKYGYYNNVNERSYFEGWNEITGNMIVWIYATSYMAMLGQPTYFDNILDTIQFLSSPEYNVMGIYCEGFYGTSERYKDGNCLDLLTMYMFARAMWEPDMTDDVFEDYMLEFLNVYYGSSAALREYARIIDDATNAVGHCWCNNFNWTFDAMSREYIAEHSEEIFTYIDTALAAEMTEAQKNNMYHLAASAYWIALSATYDSNYTNGTPEQRAAYEQRYTSLHGWMTEYDIVSLNDVRDGFTATLDFNINPYTWSKLPRYENYGPEGITPIDRIPE